VAGTPDGPYRLLSEAEWEYAVRGLTSASEPHTIYPWGDQPEGGCEYANALDVNMPETLAFERQGLNCPNSSVMATHVGSFKPNKFGLNDISGNLAEWVEDCWHESYHGRPTDASAWIKGADPNCERVIRGGSWAGELDHLRAASRVKLQDDLFGFNIGFRVARDLDWTAGD
jgi:formylglycine-generating enzyme required for sulfatase activity